MAFIIINTYDIHRKKREIYVNPDAIEYIGHTYLGSDLGVTIHFRSGYKLEFPDAHLEEFKANLVGGSSNGERNV